MKDRLVTVENLGAWLLKCHADTSDIDARPASEGRIDGWCVQPGYRTRLMEAGQRVVFWVSGSRGRRLRGIWGIGYLAGGARPAPPGSADGGRARWRVPLNLVLLAEERRVAREVLRCDGRLTELEVLRQPQAANPSVVTTAQLAVLEEYVRWPPVGPAARSGSAPPDQRPRGVAAARNGPGAG